MSFLFMLSHRGSLVLVLASLSAQGLGGVAYAVQTLEPPRDPVSATQDQTSSLGTELTPGEARHFSQILGAIHPRVGRAMTPADIDLFRKLLFRSSLHSRHGRG